MILCSIFDWFELKNFSSFIMLFFYLINILQYINFPFGSSSKTFLGNQHNWKRKPDLRPLKHFNWLKNSRLSLNIYYGRLIGGRTTWGQGILILRFSFGKWIWKSKRFRIWHSLISFAQVSKFFSCYSKRVILSKIKFFRRGEKLNILVFYSLLAMYWTSIL